MQNLRQLLAALTLIVGFAFIWLWLGVPGAAGAAFMLSVVWAALGIATGYWIGTDPIAEQMVTELMRRIRERRREG